MNSNTLYIGAGISFFVGIVAGFAIKSTEALWCGWAAGMVLMWMGKANNETPL